MATVFLSFLCIFQILQDKSKELSEGQANVYSALQPQCLVLYWSLAETLRTLHEQVHTQICIQFIQTCGSDEMVD